MRRGAIIAGVVALAFTAVVVRAQAVPDRRMELIAAKREAVAAAARAEALSVQAGEERDAAWRAARDEQALAARVAAAQASVRAAEARVALVDGLLTERRAALGERQAPVARLLAALSGLARRPAIAAIAQPGSVDDLVHVRAVLGATLPAVRTRTQGLRDAIERTRVLRVAAATAATALRDGRSQLERERVALARLEAAHRVRGRSLGRDALSESDRALALGEQARDLVDRMAEEDEGHATAAELAALPGPQPRPIAGDAAPSRHVASVYRLPVQGRLVTGLDELSDTGVRSRGLTFAVTPGAVVRAPAGGVVRYARRFRGYRGVVIIEHGQGWTTLLTGLATARVRPGDRVRAATPIGTTGKGREPRVTVELRRRGTPIDIAALVG